MPRIFVALILLAMLADGALAQQIKRTPLQKYDVPGTNYETIVALAEVAPNSSSGRHSHPGPESGYLLEGEVVFVVEGQPDRVLKTGDSFYVPAGVPHDVRTGDKTAKAIAIYIVEKGKPFAPPAK